MDKENKNNKKQKVKIKANTTENSKLILNKEFILNKKYETLILKNEVKTNIKIKNNARFSNQKIKIASSNVIKLNEKNIKTKNEILSVSKISKSLGGKPILKNISFSLKHGQILGLLGPNGAGKSTLFNLIVGKIFPDLGQIKLNNEIINELPIHKRSIKGISLLEQHKGLFGNMTAYENLYAILELYIEDKK